MTDYSKKFKTIETNVIHAGSPEPHIDGAVVTPVFQSANYLMSNESEYEAVRYIRLHNSPNHHSLHAKLAALEGAETALVTSSGMAAITATIMAFVKSGEHFLVQKTVYGGTQNFLDEDTKGLGLEFDVIDTTTEDGPAKWEKLIRPTTKLIYVESISNPLMEVGDLKAVVTFAKKHNLITVIDNTFTSPVNFRPIEIGFDIVVHSATKYLNGHSDIVAGAVIGTEEHVGKVRHLQLHLGASLDPHACFLLERGIKTLVLRVNRHNSNAMQLAEFLSSRPEIKKVSYPGLPDDPGHKYAKELFSGYGGMLSFYAKDASVAQGFINNVKIPLHAASLGGVESLVVQPSKSTHMGIPQKDRDRLGITDDLIRVSVGIENIDELMEDFAQALEGISQPSQRTVTK